MYVGAVSFKGRLHIMQSFLKAFPEAELAHCVPLLRLSSLFRTCNMQHSRRKNLLRALFHESLDYPLSSGRHCRGSQPITAADGD